MGIIESLKNKNRILLEMHIGIIFFGLICQIVGTFLVEDQWFYAKSLWFGVLFAYIATNHMYKTLDRAFLYAADATKLVTRGYMFRYVMVIIIFVVIAVTKVMNPLIVFLGYMSLKVTAYLQPLTHRLCNMIFHETDPIPEPLEEEVSEQGVES